VKIGGSREPFLGPPPHPTDNVLRALCICMVCRRITFLLKMSWQSVNVIVMMGASPRRSARILAVALSSRAFVLCLTICFHSLATSYDTSSELNTKCLTNHSIHSEEAEARGPLDRYITWDSVHFVRIAECGYEYEQSFAFFPALPLVMRALSSTLLRPVRGLLGWRGTLWLSGVLLSNSSFIASAIFLYR
jgi:phosphatidylinositol glycan class V